MHGRKNRMSHPYVNVNSTTNGHTGLILDILDWNQSWTHEGNHWNWWYWLNYWKLPQVMKKKQWGWISCGGCSQAGEGQKSVTGKIVVNLHDLLRLSFAEKIFLNLGLQKLWKQQKKLLLKSKIHLAFLSKTLRILFSICKNPHNFQTHFGGILHSYWCTNN